MKVVNDWPPNIDYLEEKYPALRTRKPYICYGDTIYNMTGEDVPKHVHVHEEVHSGRQLSYPGGVDAYIERYATDKDFARDEEVLGYAAELQYLIAQDRKQLSSHLHKVSSKLADPFYGFNLSVAQARALIIGSL